MVFGTSFGPLPSPKKHLPNQLLIFTVTHTLANCDRSSIFYLPSEIHCSTSISNHKSSLGIKGVVSVFPSRTLETQTTRSWDFLGLPEPAIDQQRVESNIVIGVFDTGIWPESPSFDDNGFDPAPQKWKGVCKGGQNFTCNKKLIGARTYFEDARDYTGHGSYSASVIAGRKVDNANFYGIANGSARGGVPFSRIAIYKICDSSKCPDTNILSAFDDAIADGVDVISFSIGGGFASLYQDAVAIGSFHAMEKGILTVQSGGNSDKIGSSAPWLLSVAASTMDRRIITKLVLGNGAILEGISVNSFTMEKDKYPLVHPVITGIYMQKPLWDEIPVKGKIVVTESTQFIDFFFGIDAAGVVSRSDVVDASYIVPGPVVILAANDFDAVMSYLSKSANPEGTILKSETVTDTSAPVVASFSSRGPNQVATDILKPDITAPGVDILAAYSPLANVTRFSSDKRRVNYSLLSGTSMACPFVAAAAAYVKSKHSDWSPAAIKSALMTTSHPMSSTKNPEGIFAYGAGHLNPMAALNPGLVYEITRDEYIIFMCKLNYTTEQINIIAKNESLSCPQQSAWKFTPTDVNYPAMLIKLHKFDVIKPFTMGFQRTVTNVGNAKSTYTAKVESADNKIKVTVEPNTLTFNSLREERSFVVSITGEGLLDGVLYSASLVWSDGIHSVRSPVGVYT
ncbi:subtilisin-like protease SBT4.8 [Silene latifolia]|uniref:subtilisin-like protease SBT4.8 n=1 Tax=Silene latifolia TaxID=37657 RepID=UPI003D770F28